MAAEKIIAVVGPTGCGKTALAVRIALTSNGELVSADSRQVYRDMTIGTGKERDPARAGVSVPELLGVPEHLIDLVAPDAPFSVADWQERAFTVIADILRRGKVPILAGGTGLYVKSIVDGLTLGGTPPDVPLRKRLERMTASELFWELRDVDPAAAARIDRRNKRRLVRAVEVARAEAAGIRRPARAWPHYDALQIGIDLPREELYRRIDARVEEQIARGLVGEVHALVKRYGKNLPALSGIGYREFMPYINAGAIHELPLHEIIQRIQFDTHAYARRQMTWFRKDRRVHWVRNPDEALSLVRDFLGV